MVRRKTTCNIETSKARSRTHGQGKKQLSATSDVDKPRSRNQCRQNLLDMVKLRDG